MEQFPTTLLTPDTPDAVTNALDEFPMLSPEEAQEPLMVTNHMQFMLALVHKDDIGAFIEKNGAKFRALIDAHPEYVAEYAENPAGVLRAIAPAFTDSSTMH